MAVEKELEKVEKELERDGEMKPHVGSRYMMRMET